MPSKNGAVISLEGSKIYLNVDHNPLTYFDTVPELSRRMARWVQDLAPFTYEWRYIPGRRNVADPLSRHPGLEADSGLTGCVVFHAACLATTMKGRRPKVRSVPAPPSSVVPKVHTDPGPADRQAPGLAVRPPDAGSPSSAPPLVKGLRQQPRGREKAAAATPLMARILRGYALDTRFQRGPNHAARHQDEYVRDGYWYRRDSIGRAGSVL